MNKLLLIAHAMKPYRALVAHLPLWGGLLWFYLRRPAFSYEQGVLIVNFLVFYGALYLLNDLFDRKEDAKDSVNQFRVIASGKLSGGEVAAACAFFMVLTFAVNFFVDATLLPTWGLLLIINSLYTLFLKKIPYVDIIWISMTQSVKFYVGMVIMTGMGAFLLPLYAPAMFLVYLLAAGLHAERFRGRMSRGMVRTYYFAGLTEYGLLVIQRITSFLAFGVGFLLFNYPLVPWMLALFAVLESVRLLFPVVSVESVYAKAPPIEVVRG